MKAFPMQLIEPEALPGNVGCLVLGAYRQTRQEVFWDPGQIMNLGDIPTLDYC